MLPGPKPGRETVSEAVPQGLVQDEAQLRSLVEVWRTRRWRDAGYTETLREALRLSSTVGWTDQESLVVRVFMEEGRRLLNTRQRHPVTGEPVGANLTPNQAATMLGVHSSNIVGWGLGAVDVSTPDGGWDREAVDAEMRALPGDEPARLAAMAAKWHQLGTPGSLLEFLERYLRVRKPRRAGGAQFTEPVKALLRDEVRRLWGAFERDKITGLPTGKKITPSRAATHLGISLTAANRFWEELEDAAGAETSLTPLSGLQDTNLVASTGPSEEFSSSIVLVDETQLRSSVERWRTRRWQDAGYKETLRDSLRLGPNIKLHDPEDLIVKVFMEEGRRLLSTRQRHPVTGEPVDVNLAVDQVAALLGVHARIFGTWGLGPVEAPAPVEGLDRESVDREMRALSGDEPARLAAMAAKWHQLGTPGSLLEFLERYVEVRVRRGKPGTSQGVHLAEPVLALLRDEARRLWGGFERDKVTGLPTDKKLTASRVAAHLGVAVPTVNRFWKGLESSAGRPEVRVGRSSSVCRCVVGAVGAVVSGFWFWFWLVVVGWWGRGWLVVVVWSGSGWCRCSMVVVGAGFWRRWWSRRCGIRISGRTWG